VAQYEILLPQTEPETEWVRGRALQKVSPKRDHARLQAALTIALDRWAAGRGEVGTEWRFRIAPPGQARRPLVPDVAYVSNERIRPLHGEDLQAPPFAPDIAVEVLSPGDRRDDLDDKIAVYLSAGSSLVIVVDPQRRIVELYDHADVRRIDETGAIEHTALPEFSLAVDALFAVLRKP
jgi:Uma2 family endonuclease